MNRLYAVECTPTLTGAMADHRLPLAARDVAHVAPAIAQALKVEGAPDADPERLERHAAWIAALARDLEGHRGKSLVVAGEIAAGRGPRPGARDQRAPWATSARRCASSRRSEQGPADQIGSLVELVRDIERGRGRHAA